MDFSPLTYPLTIIFREPITKRFKFTRGPYLFDKVHIHVDSTAEDQEICFFGGGSFLKPFAHRYIIVFLVWIGPGLVQYHIHH